MSPRDSPDDTGWIERCRAGDPDALETLARRELPHVRRLLHRLLGPRSDMEDLVQIVFLETCRALPAFRGASAIGTFVGGITVRVARRAMRPTAWAARRAPLPPETAAPALPAERGAAASEQMRRLRAALAELSAPKREAFVLWALEGMEPAAIAEVTGASLAATRSRIFYAQKELRALAAADPYLRELLDGDGDAG